MVRHRVQFVLRFGLRQECRETLIEEL